ncbi:hypothetical protein [Ureibacillus manganicus]|uniref:Uncharacterized protein n=1 Tax=Ureibacillus manganicus DSM 26584 TaxID=1384049 RepID=A0A0A3I4U0_9BACL|nr:hypothetical protein [Ureibacillus manganicus]KGR77693.1 hypothetical protein CD29_13645 [Ureibacillus manganicus DSM 26584]
MNINLYILTLLLVFILVGCDSSKSNEVNEIELDNKIIEDKPKLDEEHKQIHSIDNPDTNDDWTIYVEADEVVTNQLKCNDTTGKEIPSHLIQICNYYEKLEPLSQEQKQMLYDGTGSLAARDVFNRDMPLGHAGFAEGLEEYGEYLLFTYLYWRTELKPNSKGEFKALKFTRDFEEFFKLDVDTVETHYEPTDPNNDAAFDTLLEAIEYELNVMSRMKHLNLQEPFNAWANETVGIFSEAKRLYHEGHFNESYIKYTKGLKRIHDLYFTIPEHNHMIS